MRRVNHLAHALLAGNDDELILGGLMGDFVHGPVDPALPLQRQAGIRLHRAIDSYTDSHAQVVELRGHFAPPFRRYAGILIDVWFDHLLARDFARWSPQPLEHYSAQLLALAQRHRTELPATLHRFLDYLQRHELPAGYRNVAIIAQVYAGIGRRFTRANPLAEAMPAVLAQAPALQAGFERFFPELLQFAADWRQRDASAST